METVLRLPLKTLLHRKRILPQSAWPSWLVSLRDLCVVSCMACSPLPARPPSLLAELDHEVDELRAQAASLQLRVLDSGVLLRRARKMLSPGGTGAAVPDGTCKERGSEELDAAGAGQSHRGGKPAGGPGYREEGQDRDEELSEVCLVFLDGQVTFLATFPPCH